MMIIITILYVQFFFGRCRNLLLNKSKSFFGCCCCIIQFSSFESVRVDVILLLRGESTMLVTRIKKINREADQITLLPTMLSFLIVISLFSFATNKKKQKHNFCFLFHILYSHAQLQRPPFQPLRPQFNAKSFVPTNCCC